MHTQVSVCPQCGAPIYANEDDQQFPPKMIYSCSCRSIEERLGKIEADIKELFKMLKKEEEKTILKD